MGLATIILKGLRDLLGDLSEQLEHVVYGSWVLVLAEDAGHHLFEVPENDLPGFGVWALEPNFDGFFDQCRVTTCFSFIRPSYSVQHKLHSTFLNSNVK